MMSMHAERVRKAVLDICPEVASLTPHPGSDRALQHDDRTLWRHFMRCLLSSQVTYELACAAALEIEDAGILTASSPEVVAADLKAILARPLLVDGRMRRYRFYNTKASQLAGSWCVIQEAGGFGTLVEAFNDDHGARQWLVRCAPGLGPKQASMFLRDIGFSEDLAVLDRHTLDYMALVGLCEAGPRHVSGMGRYLVLEDQLRGHAAEVGYSLGHLDRAIWVVMRVRADAARGCH